ncbi:MAG: dCTP deaminase [Promethearchaeota archaeon]
MPIETILSKEQIINYLSERKIVVEPILEHEQIDCASIDLRIDNYFAEFRTSKKSHINPANIAEEAREYLNFVRLECFKDAYYLQPKRFVLAQTFEYLALPNNIVGRLEGRSSVARQGLTVHAAAGFVDPGFKGHLVFELLNAGEMPIKLYPLMRVAKIAFYRSMKTNKYEGQYNIQVRIRSPKNDPDLEKISQYIKKEKRIT